jgi:hypothetical protein
MSTTIFHTMACGCEFMEEFTCNGELRPRLDLCDEHSKDYQHWYHVRKVEADRDALREAAREVRAEICRQNQDNAPPTSETLLSWWKRLVSPPPEETGDT